MKKALALVLTLALSISMIACAGTDNNDSKKKDSTTTNSGTSTSNKKDSYQTFDDLPKEMDVNSDFLLSVDDAEGELYIHCNVPKDYRTESFVNGFVCNKVDAGLVVVSSGEYTKGLTVENAFPSVWNDFFLSTLKQYERMSQYDDFTPEETETVTINGMDAIRFSGVQTCDDYGTAYSYDVYGYCMVIENVPVVIAAVAGETNTTCSTDDMASIKHYADEMIETVRALDHWEEY